MASSPKIANLFTVKSLLANGRFGLSVGVALNDGRCFWGTCIDAQTASHLDESAVFDPNQAANHVEQLVLPLWQNQSAADFRPLAALLTDLSEPFAFTPSMRPEGKQAPGMVSRRSFITGLMADEDTAPTARQKIVEIERPLHPTLQYGLTAALLQAVAAGNNLSPANLIAREYDLPFPGTAVPLQVPLNEKMIHTAQAILASHVTALGYTIPKNNYKANLGTNAERLQQHVRRIAAWLPTLEPTFHPTIHLDLQGSFGELFAHNAGKILGALYGLEQATKPYLLQVQNPARLPTREAQIDHLTQLNSYLAMRRMRLQLVADDWIDSKRDAQKFASQKICQGVHIALPRMGNLADGITAVLHSLEQNQEVILSGERHPLTTHVALATRPTRLIGSPALHYNVMEQFVKAKL